MHTVGLFKAKTNLSEYLALAEAGGEVVIMRHKKPVAKIVALDAKPVPKKYPKFVQRTFDMGPELVDLTHVNQLLGDMDVMEFLKLDARLQSEAKQRDAAKGSAKVAKPKPAKAKQALRTLKTPKANSRVPA